MRGIDAGFHRALGRLPDELARGWPEGCAGVAAAAVRLRLRDRNGLDSVVYGQLGDLADAYVRGHIDIEGSMSDVIRIAAELDGGPVGLPLQSPVHARLSGAACWVGTRSVARDVGDQ